MKIVENPNTENENPIVSVLVTTFNQEKYISETLNGILMQQTNFPFEVVIGEDCSNDKTREICLSYKNKYPEIINLVMNEKNLGYSKNFLSVLKSCKGEFIAMCEGDDFWIDSNKLQYQVDFLRNHTEYSLCCHNYYIKKEGSQEELKIAHSAPYPFLSEDNEGGSFDNYINLLEYWFTNTLTVLFRSDKLDFLKLDKYNHFYDVHLYFHLLFNGKAFFMKNFTGSVYRLHNSSYHNGRDWLHRAKVAFLNDKELFEFNSDDKVIQRLFEKTRVLFLDSIRYRFAVEGIKEDIIHDLFLLLIEIYKCEGMKSTFYPIKKSLISVTKHFLNGSKN